MFEVLRQLVREEMAASPAFVIGRIEEPVGAEKSASFRGGANNAVGVRDLQNSKPQPQDNGLFIHLGEMQAVGFWRHSHVSVGGADPPVYSI